MKIQTVDDVMGVAIPVVSLATIVIGFVVYRRKSKQVKSKSEEIVNATLPEDIIATEILPRLSSIESLLKFKCVSKSWCSFISSELFAQTQLEKSSAKTSAIIIWQGFSDFSANYCPVDDLFSRQDIDVVRFDFDYPNCLERTILVGCCDGLCCILFRRKHFMLLNPATRKFHELPHVSDKDLSIEVCGYGYGESKGDYKVFASFETKSQSGRVSKLYSFKTNSWKTVEGPDFSGSLLGVLVNGKLHWEKFTFNGDYDLDLVDNPYDLEIFSFDLGSELIGDIEPPNLTNHMKLSVIHGCLCLLCSDSSHTTDVWVMKEYGVKESWCKELTLPCFNYDYVSDYHVGLPTPICVSEEGEVLVKQNDFNLFNLFIYNPKSNSFRRLVVNKPHSDLLRYPYNIGIYVTNLVSPFPHSE